MKTAIVYYSMSGNTAQTAEKIAAELGADLIRIDPVKEYPSKGIRKFIWGGKSAVMGDTPALQPYRFDGSYDRIIFGTPIWAGNFAPPIRTFIKENRDALEEKSISAFVCCAGGDTAKAFEKLRQYLEVNVLEAQLELVDPKDKPSPENDEKLKAFCKKLK